MVCVWCVCVCCGDVQVSVYIAENASKDRQSNAEIFKDFIMRFRKIMDSQTSGHKELAMAIQGYGYFAAVSRAIQGYGYFAAVSGAIQGYGYFAAVSGAIQGYSYFAAVSGAIQGYSYFAAVSRAIQGYGYFAAVVNSWDHIVVVLIWKNPYTVRAVPVIFFSNATKTDSSRS